jgi:hypothetical protein
MKIKYEIVKRNDGRFAICEIRHMNQSINVKQIYVDDTRKNCVEMLKEMKGGKK